MKVGTIGQCQYCGKPFTATNTCQIFCKPCVKLREMHRKETIHRGRYAIFERDDHKCVYCGQSPIEDGVKLVIDHIIPYSISHDNGIYNLITACNECNRSKSNRPLKQEIYERIVKRNIERNEGISPEKQQEINGILDKVFKVQKDKISEIGLWN